jgi:glycosyltransferase involved in cell wall biosynthesis
LLRHADPASEGIGKGTLWAGSITLDRVPERPWLERVHVAALDGTRARRVAWQLFERPRLTRSYDLLFAPGATPSGTFRPYVAMSPNMLPFDRRELRRFGLTARHLALEVLRLVHLQAFRNSSRIIFLTDFARDTIGAQCGGHVASRAIVVPHGVSDHFRCPPRAVRPLASYTRDDPFRFVYVSDIDLYKHQWSVAEAVYRLRREGLPVALDVVGAEFSSRAGARLRQVMKRFADDGDGVRLLPRVAHEALPATYHDAGAFVFASTCENLPITLVEAMASGLSIATTNVRPMPDIAGDAAVYFDAEDVSSIEGALRRLAVDHESRRVMAARAYQIAANYSWQRCADLTFALLGEVARSSVESRLELGSATLGAASHTLE